MNVTRVENNFEIVAMIYFLDNVTIGFDVKLETYNRQ